MKGTMTTNYEAHKAYGTSSYEKTTIIKKTPKQKKRLAKLKEKLKVANKKSAIAEKKLDSFKDKHSKVINEYINLEGDVEDKGVKWYDISEEIREYESRFIKKTYDWAI
tara:strand:+ start:997 stop:1323 length:327 start_codon:yes stop_codon:yes gene_type:complete